MIDPEDARLALLTRRREIVDLSAMARDARSVVSLDQQSVGRLSRMDALQGQAMAQASERHRVAELAGTYGDCLSFGEEIARGRLEADPAASLCIACATWEQGAKMPDCGRNQAE